MDGQGGCWKKSVTCALWLNTFTATFYSVCGWGRPGRQALAKPESKGTFKCLG